MANGFTPTQLCILSVLSDGLAHTGDELRHCLPDDMAQSGTLRMHLTNIRKKLRPHGQDILIEFIRFRVHYRQVRLLPCQSGAN